MPARLSHGLAALLAFRIVVVNLAGF